jgi:hypothetical protein
VIKPHLIAAYFTATGPTIILALFVFLKGDDEKKA